MNLRPYLISLRSGAATCAALVVAWAALGAGWVCAGERRLVPNTDRKTVVLDPGHGGADTGARGPDGTLEKDVALRVAQLVSMRLRNTHRVVLTRSDDYSLSLIKRTEAANYHRADLFLSIHTGGGYMHTKSGVTIFSYENRIDEPFAATPRPLQPGFSAGTQRLWNHLQPSHRAAGRRFAQAIHDRLCGDAVDSKCRIESAPLMVLIGADMPALLVEIGYVTNPRDERNLKDKDRLSAIAAAISNGIVDFLSGSPEGDTPYE